MPEQSLLDARLAEIDRRLRAIQSGLRPAEEEPAPSAPVSVPEPEYVEKDPLEATEPEPAEPAAPAEPAEVAAARPALVEELRALGDAHERLLELHRELLSEYASLLERRVVEEPPPPGAADATVAVDAGPFADADAVRAFEQALTTLPQVTEVAVREYLANDRVVIDVGLAR